MTEAGYTVEEAIIDSGELSALTTHGHILIPDDRNFATTGFSVVFDSRLSTLCPLVFLTAEKLDLPTRRLKMCEHVDNTAFPETHKIMILGVLK